MMDWLLDTIVWTAALIALVLLVRRPVARWFGPQTAYALWALPIMRLFLPPIELPAWMAPQQIPPVGIGEGVVPAASPSIDVLALLADRSAATPAPEASFWSDLPLTEITLGLWSIGLAAFLYLRFRAYFAMRRELLAEAREVGSTEGIRLLETPATNAPLAFGVRDKVVALPEGFMARYDRDQRDLALAHELAHHKGRDLLVNMLAQPLFAIHWFNPLARIGWLALRRDQEAACDARVISDRCQSDRATYASVIASFAAGPNVALAAPMACPVLGDKSIIQRLRSLKMSDLSNRRRMAGRGLVAAALIALPLTASISYAETTIPAPPAPPAVPAAPDAPVPPLPPAPPAAPAPLAPLAFQAAVEGEDDEHDTYVIHEVHKDKDGNEVHKEKRRHIIIKDEDGTMTKEEREEMLRELREGLAEMDVEIKEAMAEARIAIAEMHDGEHGITTVNITCKDGSQGTEVRDDKGKSMTRICTSEIMAQALNGLKEARNAIAKESEMPDDIRADVLKELDQKIANWDAKGA